mgnify:CR=1 FL=1
MRFWSALCALFTFGNGPKVEGRAPDSPDLRDFFPLMLTYHVVRYLDTRQKVQEQYAGSYVQALKMLKVFLIVGQCAWIVELEDDVPF